MIFILVTGNDRFYRQHSWPKQHKRAESVRERKKNKFQVPAGDDDDDDDGRGMFDVWKFVSTAEHQ